MNSSQAWLCAIVTKLPAFVPRPPAAFQQKTRLLHALWSLLVIAADTL